MKTQKQQKQQIVIGRKPVVDHLSSGGTFERLFLQQQIAGEIRTEILRLGREAQVPVQFVPKVKLDKLSRGNHQGVIALKSLVEYQPIGPLIATFFDRGIEPRIAVLDGITDVRNFGAIARSAEIFGLNALLVGQKNAAPVNDLAIKASAGALLSLPLCRTGNLPDSLREIKDSGLRIGLAATHSEVNIDKAQLSGPIAIILGSEGEGIHPTIAQYADFAFSIPQVGATESLNVSVAAGIIFYEMMKQSKTL